MNNFIEDRSRIHASAGVELIDELLENLNERRLLLELDRYFRSLQLERLLVDNNRAIGNRETEFFASVLQVELKVMRVQQALRSRIVETEMSCLFLSQICIKAPTI